MFKDSTSVDDTINQITDQLAMFEANATDFDDFISAFAVDEEGNNADEEE